MQKHAVLAAFAVLLAGNAVGLPQNGEQRIAPSEFTWPTGSTGGVGTSGAASVRTVEITGSGPSNTTCFDPKNDLTKRH